VRVWGVPHDLQVVLRLLVGAALGPAPVDHAPLGRGPACPAALRQLILPCLARCSRWWSPELPEWDMEKYRFYVDLPGDFWDSGLLLDTLKERMVQIVWDSSSKQYVLPYKHLTKLGEVRTELQVLDAGDR